MILGSEVHIDIYDDRLEIYSPGGMYDGSLVQNLNPRSVSSTRRNPVIADIFSRLECMERRGSGFKKILEAYEFHPKYTEEYIPEFRSTQSGFWLVLKNFNYVPQGEPQGDTQDDTQDDTQGDTQDKMETVIINSIKENNKITLNDIAKKIGVSRITVYRKIQRMNNVKYIGSGYSGHWEIDE